MRKIGLLCTSLMVVLALTGTAASGAPAKKLLELKLDGAPIAKGTEVGLVVGWSLGECIQGAYEVESAGGTVSVNHATTDKVSSITSTGPDFLPPTDSGLCDDGYEGDEDFITGSVGTIELTHAGHVTLTMNTAHAPLRIHLFEPGISPSEPVLVCTYEFKKLSGTFATSGHAEFTVSGVGRLYKPDSSPKPSLSACAKTAPSSLWEAFLFANHPGDIVETELVDG